MKIYNINTDNMWVSGIIACLYMLFIGYFGYSGNMDMHSYIGLLTVLFFLMWIFGIAIGEIHDEEIEDRKKWNEDIKKCLGEFYITTVSQKKGNNKNDC